MKKIPLFASLLVLLACWLTLSVAGALVSPSVLARTTDPLTPPAPAAETVTILFDPAPAGEPQAYTVKKGSPLPEIPTAPSLPAARFLGWYDENGVQVHPSRYTPIQKSAVYTARWQRRLDELLELNVHKTYISGRANGLFGPNDPLSRAEACQMIYTLLKTHSWPKKQFSDVHSDAWYAPAVETLAGLGVLSGRPDGTFAPDQPMSRAEFVTLVTNLNFSHSGRSVFPDTQGHWAETRIAAANEAGWISGQPDGTFAPEASITRAQAVTVLNRVLGRPATSALQTCTDAKGFCDVFPEHWAYGDILEASTAHQYTRSAGKETWSTYEKAVLPTTGKWIRENGALYYVEPSTGKCARGDRKIDGTEYKFDPVTGQAYTGFAQRQGWRRYYLDGALQEDLSGLGVVEGPYRIEVYKNQNYVVVFAQDDSGQFNTPVRAMLASCGKSTPIGTWNVPATYRWLNMVDNSWGQWCTQIWGNYLFHSVPYYTHDNADLEWEEFNHLGETRSLGCVRLCCGDAKWIYDHCAVGTQVTITNDRPAGALEKPQGLQLEEWHTWDPTDPNAQSLCQAHGCSH